MSSSHLAAPHARSRAWARAKPPIPLECCCPLGGQVTSTCNHVGAIAGLADPAIRQPDPPALAGVGEDRCRHLHGNEHPKLRRGHPDDVDGAHSAIITSSPLWLEAILANSMGRAALGN